MRYADIRYPDTANGTGVRVSIFLQGCSRRCEGCFNRETWDFDGGYVFDSFSKAHLFSLLAPHYVKGLSILGGEPLEQIDELIPLLQEVKKRYPQKDIWLWTGYTFEDIRDSSASEILPYLDVIVDGSFIESKKDISLKFRGSSNQRLIRLKEGKAVKIE